MTINPLLFIQQFSMSSLTTQDLVSIINSNYDFTNCIVNCSSNGLCKFSSNNTFVCECLANYAGHTCAQDIRPCSHSPCLNNATCLPTNNSSINPNITNSAYECMCAKNFYGTNCEYKINICENERCSGNGICVDENDVAVCNCFWLYSGDKCEIESQTQKKIKQTAITTSIIAIVILVLFYVLVILSDVLNFFCKKSTRRAQLSKQQTVKLKYTP